MKRPKLLTVLLIVGTFLSSAACDHGFAPPEAPTAGTLVADVDYVDHPDSWPPAEQLRQLLFVAMRFVPRDTTDFLRLSGIVFSDPLELRVPRQQVVIEAVPIGSYVYSGVAQKYGSDIFDWRPVGLVEENGGVFLVAAGETTFVSVTVDFGNPPHFPPLAAE